MLQCLDYCARSRRFNVPGRSCGYATQRPYPVLVLHVWVRCCVNPYNRRALSCYDQVQSTIALLCVVDTCLLEECMAACIALERSESFETRSKQHKHETVLFTNQKQPRSTASLNENRGKKSM